MEAANRYHALFDSLDEGFCIVEFLDGPHCPLSDYIDVEANAACACHAGIQNVVGQKVPAHGASRTAWRCSPSRSPSTPSSSASTAC